MAVKGLLKYVEDLDWADDVSIAKARTQDGHEVSQQRGPYLYGFNVNIPNCLQNSDDYRLVKDQLLSTVQGTQKYKSSLPANITEHRGAWSGTPIVNQPTATVGDEVVCDGGPTVMGGTVDYAKIGDFVQFSGDVKVYQLTEDSDADATGNFTLHLNSPLSVASTDNSTITFGNDVEFQYVVRRIPKEKIIKRDSTTNIVVFGSVQCREVL